ncbi:glycosyltransferase family 4 protein [Nocardioides currus]|uniref:Glycosyltransferase WbuB n=1 Tax=Nocardioides currus TaxID=2133958 RepID=A0A2R7YYP2_9ACTN|nr:glycosyltransferase family 4 protein [Nocardioides currus]PUA81483.1 glycosyltransferase WbuB [Nocardioides currus]
MRILVFDFSGHPFQAQLSRELVRRGHDVVHSWCAAYVSGRGQLAAKPGETVRFEPVSTGRSIAKTSYLRRSLQEVRLGLDLVRHVLRRRPEVVLVANTPIPMLVMLGAVLAVRRTPFVLWHQDAQALAVSRLAGTKLSPVFGVLARVLGWGERWASRRAKAVVAITPAFLAVHEEWGTADKVTVIPNWAPLDEITPRPRDNDWAARHDLVTERTLLYSGTLGLKHDPELLVGLAAAVRGHGTPVRLVVVNEGPAEPVVRAAAERHGVPLTLLPFQAYDDLPDVLAAGDLLVVLLEQDAGEFSVPSKTLSYLAAGRPVLGLMPPENLAARLIADAGGYVAGPHRSALAAAAAWADRLLRDPARLAQLGSESRALAEREFGLARSAEEFERILTAAVGRWIPDRPFSVADPSS